MKWYPFGPSRLPLAGVRAIGLVLALSAFGALPAAAQQSAGAAALVLGRVADEARSPIVGAAVTLFDEAGERAIRTTVTDVSGMYRMVAVPPGRYRVRASFIGYEPSEQPASVGAGSQVRVDLEMRVGAVALAGVEVQARRDRERERSRFETEAGVTARVIDGEQLKILPGLAEADVLRAVELLPGVVSTSDFSSAFNVRGGSADQNLILIDGFPIFNPFHLGGLFSVFNPDMIARAELLAGGFGAEFGGRVSSVLNVESRVVPDQEGVGIETGVSLLAARIAMRSALPQSVARAFGGQGGSWSVSARRSYFDQVLRPVIDFPYHLTDVQAHAAVGTARGGRLSLTAYTGDDVLDLTDFTPPGEDASEILRLAWRWGNDVIGLHWQQPLGGAWLSDTRVGFSRYRDALRFADFDDTRFSSRISQLSARTDLARDLGRLSVRTGVEAARLRYGNLAQAGGTVFAQGADDGATTAGFVTTRWRADDAWLVDAGIRADAWFGRGATHAAVSPRFGVKRFLGVERDAAIKLSLGRYVQFLQSLRNEEFPLSNDIWYAADEHTPMVVSDQLQVGVEKFWDERWSASVEAYTRRFRGVAEFNPASDPNTTDDDLLTGRGRSSGLDVLVRRTAGALTGWTTLSLLRAERTMPDPFALGFEDLPSEINFAPFWDRRVNLNVVLQYDLPRGVEAGLRWNYGTGLPYTRPIAQHVAWDYRQERNRYRLSDSGPRSDEGPPLFVVPGGRNAERYPPYQRLDVSVRRRFQPRWGTLTPYLQVLNLTNERNVLFYFYNYDRTPPTRSGISMFPVLPTIGVEATF